MWGEIRSYIPHIPSPAKSKWPSNSFTLKMPREGEPDLHLWIKSSLPTLDKWESDKVHLLCERVFGWLEGRTSLLDPVEGFEQRPGFYWLDNHIMRYTPFTLPGRNKPTVHDMLNVVEYFQIIIERCGARKWEYWLVDQDVHVAYGEMTFIRGPPPPVFPPPPEFAYGNQTADARSNNTVLDEGSGPNEAVVATA